MKPKGEDTASALREWLKEEIKVGPSSRLGLGKFFFGVSSGSLGALVAFKKLDESIRIDTSAAGSLALLVLSLLVALLMVVPKIWPLRGDTDLLQEHKRQVQLTARSIVVWFLTWLLGISLGVFSVLFE